VGVLKDGHLLFQGGIDDLLVGHASPAYTVRVRDGIDDVAAALAGEAWVGAVERLGAEELRVTATALDDAQRRLVPALAATGARIVSVLPAEADLERVFLELTR
jgi:hypothetical protein